MCRVQGLGVLSGFVFRVQRAGLEFVGRSAIHGASMSNLPVQLLRDLRQNCESLSNDGR